LFGRAGINNAVWLPFACDPGLHGKIKLTSAESSAYGCDVCFVGSVHPGLYPGRIKLLESISDLDIKVWGPGAEALPASSPLRARIAGGKTTPEQWTRIYSAAKIVLCMHYSHTDINRYPCYQASPRVYEAMACGAFLLCDAQKDVMTLFQDGKHLGIFRGAEDLRKKITYYLANSEKRGAIAKAGQDEVIGKHTYLDRIKVVLGTVRAA
jgi:spore maturation protein CgeB